MFHSWSVLALWALQLAPTTAVLATGDIANLDNGIASTLPSTPHLEPGIHSFDPPILSRPTSTTTTPPSRVMPRPKQSLHLHRRKKYISSGLTRNVLIVLGVLFLLAVIAKLIRGRNKLLTNPFGD